MRELIVVQEIVNCENEKEIPWNDCAEGNGIRKVLAMNDEKQCKNLQQKSCQYVTR